MLRVAKSRPEDARKGGGHRKVRARLLFRGRRTAKLRVLRLMRENGLLAPVRAGRPRGPRAHDRSPHAVADEVIDRDEDTCSALSDRQILRGIGAPHFPGLLWILERHGYKTPGSVRKHTAPSAEAPA